MRCPSCQTIVSITSRHCPLCGSVVTPPEPVRLPPQQPRIQQGICPACTATTIYREPDRSSWIAPEGQRSRLLPFDRGSFNTEYAKLTAFVCASCGYLEEYVLDVSERNQLAKEWEPVSVAE